MNETTCTKISFVKTRMCTTKRMLTIVRMNTTTYIGLFILV